MNERFLTIRHENFAPFNSRNLSESDRQMMAKYEKCDIQMSAIHWPGKRLHSSPVSSFFDLTKIFRKNSSAKPATAMNDFQMKRYIFPAAPHR